MDEKGNLVEMDLWYRMVIMPYYDPKWPLVTGSGTKLCRIHLVPFGYGPVGSA